MNRAIIMKDRRLIEALDYIDDEYIASAALYKMRAYAESTRPLAQTAGQSVKKHWKHYLGFVACLLVLALATPLFGYLPEIINSFAAGWGEGTETLEVPETTNGMYDEYILTEDDLAQLNYAYERWIIGSKYADSVEEAMTQKYGPVYIGKFGDCIAYVCVDNPAIDLYADSFWVCYESKIYSLEDAVNKQLITDEDLSIINRIYEKKIKIYSVREHLE